MKEFDGDHAMERRHGDGHPRLLSPHQRALGSVQGLPGPAGRGGSLAAPAGAEEQVGRPPGIPRTLRKPFFGATSR